MRESVAIALLLLILILLPGCVTSAVYPSERERALRERCIDRDDDGRLDQCVCVFAPKAVGNVSVQRQVIVERAAVVTQLFITNNATGIITVKIDETIPPQLTTRTEKILFEVKPTSASGVPIVASWSFTFSEPVEKQVSYKISAFQEITCKFVEEYYSSPFIRTESYEILAIPFFAAAHSALKGLYDYLIGAVGFWPGLTTFLALLVVLAFLVWEAVLWLGAYVVSVSARRKYYTELLRWLGRGRREWAPWVLAAVVMLVVGAAIFLTVGEAEGSAGLPALERAGRNPPHLVGLFVALLAIVSICGAAIDAVRGTLLGPKYFMSPLDAARADLTRLRSALAVLEAKLEELAGQGIDVDKELVVLEVERARAQRIERELTDETAEAWAPIIRRAALDVDTSLALLEDKRIATIEWPKWDAEIAAALRTADKVEPAQLPIPIRWRRWALMKYVSEHLGEGLAVEGGTLVRIKAPPLAKKELETAAGAFVRQFGAIGFALARKDGLLVVAELPRDIDKNIIAAVAAKFIATASMCGTELGQGRVGTAIIRTDAAELVLFHGATLIALAILPPAATTAFTIAEMEKIVHKFELGKVS